MGAGATGDAGGAHHAQLDPADGGPSCEDDDTRHVQMDGHEGEMDGLMSETEKQRVKPVSAMHKIAAATLAFALLLLLLVTALESEGSVQKSDESVQLAGPTLTPETDGEPNDFTEDVDEAEETPASPAPGDAAPDVGLVLKPDADEIAELDENGHRRKRLCAYGAYGRLNNQLVAVKGGILMAHMLNRTFVVPSYIASMYNVSKLSEMAPHLVTEFRPNMCKGESKSRRVHDYCFTEASCDPTDPRVLSKLVKMSDHIDVLGLSGFILFRVATYMDKVTGFDFERAFYSRLMPVASLEAVVSDYITRTFADREYAAVHLRDLENSCQHRMKTHNYNIGLMLCNAPRPVFLEVMQDVAGRDDLPIFVASDHENKKALATYTKAGDHLFDGKCTSDTCAVIDFEIAARSNFFVGVVVSSASYTVRELRRHRRLRFVGEQYPSVLSWSRDPEEKAFDKGHYLVHHEHGKTDKKHPWARLLSLS